MQFCIRVDFNILFRPVIYSVSLNSTSGLCRSEYGKDYDYDSPVKLLDLLYYGRSKTLDEQVVVLGQVLAADCTVGYEEYNNHKVKTSVHTYKPLKYGKPCMEICRFGVIQTFYTVYPKMAKSPFSFFTAPFCSYQIMGHNGIRANSNVDRRCSFANYLYAGPQGQRGAGEKLEGIDEYCRIFNGEIPQFPAWIQCSSNNWQRGSFCSNKRYHHSPLYFPWQVYWSEKIDRRGERHIIERRWLIVPDLRKKQSMMHIVYY